MELVLVEEENWGSQLLHGLQRLYEHEMQCDIGIVTTDQKTILAHSVVISVSCPLVTRQAISTGERTMTLNVNLRHEVMMKLVDFMYYGEVSFPKAILQDVWDGANQLRLQSLRVLLEKRLAYESPQAGTSSHSESQGISPSATTPKHSEFLGGPSHDLRKSQVIPSAKSSAQTEPLSQEFIVKDKRGRDDQSISPRSSKKPRPRSPTLPISISSDSVPRLVKVEPVDLPVDSDNEEEFSGFDDGYDVYRGVGDEHDEGTSSSLSNNLAAGILNMGHGESKQEQGTFLELSEEITSDDNNDEALQHQFAPGDTEKETTDSDSTERNEKVESLMCAKCGCCCKSKRSFYDHMRRAHKDKDNVCVICRKAFKSIYELKRHGLIHSEIKPFVCAICKEGLCSKWAMKRHMLGHYGEKQFACQYCQKLFVQKDCLRSHIRINHSTDVFPCPSCGKKFSHKVGLKRHICRQLKEKKEKSVEGPVSCSTCGKTFAHKRYLKQHEHMHEKPSYLCNKCGKTFKWKTSIKHHKKTCKD